MQMNTEVKRAIDTIEAISTTPLSPFLAHAIQLRADDGWRMTDMFLTDVEYCHHYLNMCTPITGASRIEEISDFILDRLATDKIRPEYTVLRIEPMQFDYFTVTVLVKEFDYHIMKMRIKATYTMENVDIAQCLIVYNRTIHDDSIKEFIQKTARQHIIPYLHYRRGVKRLASLEVSANIKLENTL